MVLNALSLLSVLTVAVSEYEGNCSPTASILFLLRNSSCNFNSLVTNANYECKLRLQRRRLPHPSPRARTLGGRLTAPSTTDDLPLQKPLQRFAQHLNPTSAPLPSCFCA